MTQPRDPDDAIRSWLADKPEQAPERAVMDTIDRLRVTNQPRMFVLAMPMPLAAAVAVLLVVVLTLGLWANVGHVPVGATPSPSATPSPTASPTCSFELAVGGFSAVFVGRGFKPDSDVTIELFLPDGSHATILPTDIEGLHTDSQGRFAVTFRRTPTAIGTTRITAVGDGCTASLEATRTASDGPTTCVPAYGGPPHLRGTAGYRDAVNGDSPSHWWHFDDPDTDVLADSAGDATGTRVGSVELIPSEGDEHAVYLDGAGSYVSLPEISLDGDFTVEAWVYLCEVISNEDAIVGHGRGTPNLNFHDAHLRLFLGDPLGDFVVANTGTLNEEWTHWAITRTGDTTMLYRNGVLDASATGWTGPMVIDEIGRGDAGELRGLIDEVALYDRALPAERLLAHVRAGGK